MTEPTDSPVPARPLDYGSPPRARGLVATIYPLTPTGRATAGQDILILTLVLGGYGLLLQAGGLAELFLKALPRGGVYLQVLFNGLLALATVVLLLRRSRQHVDAIGLNRAPAKLILAATAAAVPASFAAGGVVNVAVAALRGQTFDAFAKERTEFFEVVSDVPLGAILPIAVFVGIYEEILFRGFLLTRLRALFGGDAAAILISSIVFGAVHFTQGPAGMCQTGVVGLVLALVATRVRTLWPAMLAHTAIDTLSLLGTSLLQEELRHLLEQTTRPAA